MYFTEIAEHLHAMLAFLPQSAPSNNHFVASLFVFLKVEASRIWRSFSSGGESVPVVHSAARRFFETHPRGNPRPRGSTRTRLRTGDESRCNDRRRRQRAAAVQGEGKRGEGGGNEKTRAADTDCTRGREKKGLAEVFGRDL